jgi:hypothetical protein
MANVARKLSHAEPSYEVATVAAVEATEITVRTARGQRRAQRAASCLVAPDTGDEVALVVTGDGRVFVIAVLVRGTVEKGLEIVVDGDLRIRAEGTMSLVSKVLNMRAEEGNVVLSKLTVLASSLLAHTDAVRVAAKTIDSFCERLSQTAKRCFRKVEELDHLRAERVDYRTEKEMSLRSEHLLASARKLVKVDSEQIHIG